MPTDSNRDEHGLKKPEPHAEPKRDADHPGYEITDVNTRGVVVFLGGLIGFLLVFFVLCFAMGKAINIGLNKQDGDEASLHPKNVTAGGSPASSHKREDLASNPTMQQKESAIIAQSFPTPRLDIDDSNQGMADMHAREDLLLDHYSTIDGNSQTLRIPIEHAMDLIVERGLPQAQAVTAKQTMSGDMVVAVQQPLTNGFARTSWELEQMESREQKMKYSSETKSSTQAKLEK